MFLRLEISNVSDFITEACVEQFSSNVRMLVQQQGTRLRSTVMEDSVNAATAFYERIGTVAAQIATSRHADSPQVDTPHSRRNLTLATYRWGDMVDNPDQVRTLIDPTNRYVQAATWAFGRTIDVVIRTAMNGTANTGGGGGGTAGTATLPATQKVAVDFVESGASSNSGLTVGKLREAARILGENEVPEEGRFIAVAQQQITDLLRDDEVTSADYNTVKALVTGEVNSFMGFTFVRTQQLNLTSGDIRDCLAYHRNALMLGIGSNPRARVSERADKSYSTYAFMEMDIGAVRMEEEMVVEVKCDESP